MGKTLRDKAAAILSQAWPVVILGLVAYVCIRTFLLTLAGIACGPAAHPAAYTAAHLHTPFPTPTLLAESQAQPSGMTRLQSKGEWR